MSPELAAQIKLVNEDIDKVQCQDSRRAAAAMRLEVAKLIAETEMSHAAIAAEDPEPREPGPMGAEAHTERAEPRYAERDDNWDTSLPVIGFTPIPKEEGVAA